LAELASVLKDAKGVAEATNLRGLAAKSMEQWDQARKMFSEAAKMFEQIGDGFGVANCHNNMGLVEYLNEEGDADAAGKHFQAALSIRGQLGDARGVAEACVNLGALAQKRKELDTAEEFYGKAL